MKEQQDMTRPTMGSIFLVLAGMFYISAWKTGNMDFVQVANYAAIMFGVTVLVDIIFFVVINARKDKEVTPK